MITKAEAVKKQHALYYEKLEDTEARIDAWLVTGRRRINISKDISPKMMAEIIGRYEAQGWCVEHAKGKYGESILKFS